MRSGCVVRRDSGTQQDGGRAARARILPQAGQVIVVSLRAAALAAQLLEQHAQLVARLAALLHRVFVRPRLGAVAVLPLAALRAFLAPLVHEARDVEDERLGARVDAAQGRRRLTTKRERAPGPREHAVRGLLAVG